MSSNKDYCNIPFCHEISRDEFYTFTRIETLIRKCEQNREDIIKCRSLGLLSSLNGRFYLKDLELPLNKSDISIRVSLKYLKEPLKSTVMPQAVQVFGTLQWTNKPVIYANILQPLNTAMAIRLHGVMCSILQEHLAKDNEVQEDT